jgi:GNAT superfamily N-acetyltransferase
MSVQVHPLTSQRWPDLEALFGENGAEGGCWCMWWRLKPKDYARNAGQGNKLAFRGLVNAGQPVGLMAYAGERAVGWCSVAPREQLLRIPSSTTWRPVDDLPVWSISCFFVDKAHRGAKIASKLLSAAVEYARVNGAGIVEAYPKDVSVSLKPEKDRSLYFGTVDMFRGAGFEEVIRRHPAFPIMRLWL